MLSTKRKRISTLDLFFRHSLCWKELALQREKEEWWLFSCAFIVLNQPIVWSCTCVGVQFTGGWIQLSVLSAVFWDWFPIFLSVALITSDFRTIYCTFSALLNFLHVLWIIKKLCLKAPTRRTTAYRHQY